MEHHQVPFVDVGRDEQVEGLRLVDEGRAVGGELEQPALVDLEAGLEHVLFFLRQEVEVLDAAALLEDRVPHLLAVLRLLLEQLLEVRVLDREAARQRLVGVDVGRDRLDAGAGAAGDDRDRRGRRDRHLAAEALHHAHVGGVGAGPALLGEHHRRLVDLGADVLEDLEVPALRHRPFERQVARLEEGVEAHHAEADRALALGAVLGARHLVGRAGDVVGEHVVEEAHDVLDELLVLVPLVPGFEVERATGSTPRCGRRRDGRGRSAA